ncbi:MAG: TonB-dependent receptor [Ignavibacteria bacterium]
MKKLLFVIVLTFLLAHSIFAQKTLISGYVVDDITKKALSDVEVTVIELGYRTVTDVSGYFTFKDVSPGAYQLEFIKEGYKTQIVKIRAITNVETKVDIKLIPIEINIGEIKVTSTRYESSIKDVAVPLVVVDEIQIDKVSYETVSGVLSTKPGINLTRDGIWATDINIRGLSRNNVVTLIDGNRIETANDLSARLSMVDLFDIDRIEVIKGSVSSLYGTGAFGGVVNIFTREPNFSVKPYIKSSFYSGYSSVNSLSLGNLSLMFGGKSFIAKINGTLRDASNTNTPQGEIPNSQFRDNSISMLLGFRFLNNHAIKLNYQRFYAHDVGIPGASSLFPATAIVSYPKEQRELYSLNYEISNLGSVLKTISAKYFYQYILRDVQNLVNQVSIKKASNGNLIQKTIVDKITPVGKHYVNGIQLLSNWTIGINNVIIGVDIWQRNMTSERERFQTILKYDSTSGMLTSVTSKITGEKPLPVSEYRNIGGFLQDEVKLLNNKLKINLGARADQIRVSNAISLNPYYEVVNGVRNDFPTGQKITWLPSQSDEISWSANIGAIYTILKDVDLVLNFSRSFRSPSLEERYQYIDLGSLIKVGNPALNSEKGLYGDFGLRIWKNTFTFNGDIFINSFTDLVVEKSGIYDSRPALIKTNVGKALLYGYDFEAMYNFYLNYVFYTSLSLVRGRDTENELDLPQIPPLNGRCGIRGSLLSYVNFDLNAVLFNRQDRIAPGEIGTPGYAIFNISLNSKQFEYKVLKLQLFAGVDNILDKGYRNHLSTNRGLVTFEPGRNFYFRLKIDI